MLARSPDVMDVIIIGGGIIGASTAWRLARAGAAVTLVDAGALGGEASWAGAGMLAPGGEIAGRSRWAEFALESLALYPGFVEELESETGLGIDYRRCGAVEMARTEAEWRDLMARRAAQSELGIRSEVTGGGLFYPDDALVDPRDVTRALRRACEKRRVRIREQTRVLAVRVTRERAEVETSGGVLRGAAAGRAARHSGFVSGARAPAGVCAGTWLTRANSAPWAHVCYAAIQRIHHCGDFIGAGGLQPRTGPANSGRYTHACRRVGAAAAFGSGAYSVAGGSSGDRGLRAGDRPPGGYVPVAGIWALSEWDTAGAGYGEAGGGGDGYAVTLFGRLLSMQRWVVVQFEPTRQDSAARCRDLWRQE